MDRQTAFMLAHGVLRIDLGLRYPVLVLEVTNSKLSRSKSNYSTVGQNPALFEHVSWADDHARATGFESLRMVLIRVVDWSACISVQDCGVCIQR
ncbi:hypothetical protein L226DRAFT_368390 [Lentinus tigrinus ALCF2SS1-7]|uniref:Uncharacterized protein n=1 Tax=Lentinus tigrinus ALCF2SS1-6 TaxID=1328759 RepID=A0A5C2RM89_9APHY|nr:hypothetical protein L227DRAFT_440084 [Lentinus tigrinus ALCF2SS1-6]RPD68074.1 hypothetical protein L226DRAFT_368390 [Lentinus tigrinus ALCF2SS1-7]